MDLTDAETLAIRRSECIDAWEDNAPEDSGFIELRGGILDGFNVRWAEGESDWSGAYYDDEGRQIMVRYVMGEDGPEPGGTKLMTDIADEAIADQFPSGSVEPDVVDLDQMTAAEATEFLIEDNDRRVTELMELSGGQVDLTNAFDTLFIKVYLRHLVEWTHEKLANAARLDFEDQRSRLLDEVTDKMAAMQAEREKMVNQARLMGGQGAPMMMGPNGPVPVPAGPMHQGRGTLPSKRVRRG